MTLSYQVVWKGPVHLASGIGHASREYVRALRRAGVRVSVNKQPSGRNGLHRVLIYHFRPDTLHVAKERKRFDTIIVNTVWETTRVPRSWVGPINRSDAVMIPSRQNRQALLKSGVRVPIHLVPHGVHAAKYAGMKRVWPSKKRKTTFVFLSVFGFQHRKNPEKLLRAYWETFSADEPVKLIIKTNGYTSKESGAYIRNRIAAYKNQLGIRRRTAPVDGRGGRCSMIQRIWHQLERADLSDSVLAAIVRGQEELLFGQLGRPIPVILEPERRDTFPSIALAAAYLHSVKGAGREEVVCMLPADTFTEVAFFHQIKRLETLLLSSGADLTLMGVKPAYSSEEHGYLVPVNINKKKGSPDRQEVLTIGQFVEKPDADRAVELIERQALWNCGVFAFRLAVLLDWLQERDFPADYAALVQRFGDLPKTSFDYEIAEKAKSIIALAYDGIWKDLGSWRSLTEELDCTVIGQGSISEDSQNCHLINELDTPAHVIGLSNIIVAIGKDGILIADKRASGRIKIRL